MYFEINFDDLKKEVQEELLKCYGIEAPEDANLDIVPLVVIEIDN